MQHENVLSEGVLDFLKGIWSKAGEFFSGTVEKFQSKVTELVSSAIDKNTEIAAEDLGIPSTGGSFKLNPAKSENDRKVYLKSAAPTLAKVLEKAPEDLRSTKSVKNWTPKSNSRDDLKSWMDKNRESSSGLWKATGKVSAVSESLKKSCISFDKQQNFDKEKANPAEAIKFILSSCKSIQKAWESVKDKELQEDVKIMTKAISSLQSVAIEVGKSIASSAKSQQNESRQNEFVKNFVNETLRNYK